MTGGKIKNYSHIWDNVMTSNNSGQHQPLTFTHRDTTGSSVSIVEYSRSEITVHGYPASARVTRQSHQPTCHLKNYPIYPNKTGEKSKKSKRGNGNYCTNMDRQAATPPTALSTWKFQKERPEKYDSSSVSNAFNEYAHRLSEKKIRLEQERLAAAQNKIAKQAKRVTIKEYEAEFCQSEKKYHSGAASSSRKVEFSNRRDDEVRIDAIRSNKRAAISIQNAEDAGEVQKTPPAFYGTIEAEMCAENAAGYISMASEQLERLQFVAGSVFPETEIQLKKLQEIDGDVKGFGHQLRSHRVKPPTSLNCSQVAHFIIADSCAD